MKQSLAKGTKLGSYSIIRLVGRGGMGEVYEAYEHRLRRTVALKVIAPVAAGQHDEYDLVRRFVKEAHTLAQINHPNVVTIYAIDSESDMQFIAMEYVDGLTLKKITSLVSLSADEAVPLFLQTLEGLRALHENQILHRDLKPNNLMVRLDGKVKVLDFGIAKRFGDKRPEQTEVGVVVGTLPYLAPEVLAGHRADVRSDLWSLGAIFYETLTGHPLVSLNTKRVRGVRALPDSDVIFPEETLAWIPEQMRTIVARLCDGRPDHRFANANEAIEALQKFQQNRPGLPAEFLRTFHEMLSKLQAMPFDEKNQKDPIAKRALAVSLLSGEPVENAEKRLEPEIPEEDDAQLTQVVLDSVSKRNRARRQRRQDWKQPIQYAALAIVAMLLFKGASVAFNAKNQSQAVARIPASEAPVQPVLTETPIQLTGPQSSSVLWLSRSELPTLSWSKVLPVQEYELQISNDATFSSTVVREVVSGNIYRPGRILPEGEYHWRLVSLHDANSIVGPSSFTISYLAPMELTWPPSDQVFYHPKEEDSYQVALAWKCRTGATSYRLQISRDSTFATVEHEQIVDNACSTDEAALPDGNYYWRVRVEEPSMAQATWSEARSVSIIPAKDEVLPEKPVAVAKGTPTAVKRTVPKRPAPVHRQANKKVAVASGRAPASLPAPTPVVAQTKPAVPSVSRTPDVPAPIAPANGLRVAIGNSSKLSVIFSWTPIATATDYVIEIAHDSEFKNIIDHHAVKPAKYVMRNKQINGYVYWRVRTISRTGPSAWSPANLFEVTNSQVAKNVN